MTRPREINVRKATWYAVVVNGMEIAVLIAFAAYVSLVDVTQANRALVRWLAIAGASLASFGAMVDIREALLTRGRVHQIADLTQTNAQMDTLNHALRAQRHDFLNHLQVVYSLLEMREYAEATDYLDKVYGEIRALSTVLRTQSTAVNALIRVKAQACAERGVALRLDIRSPLESLPIPSWEMCRVLGNLLDNAMDAVADAPEPSVTLGVTENLQSYVFTVENNGSHIPASLAESIFEAGVSTKGEGRGMGLSIVRRTLAAYGGDVAFESGDGRTRFTATVPKPGER